MGRSGRHFHRPPLTMAQLAWRLSKLPILLFGDMARLTASSRSVPETSMLHALMLRIVPACVALAVAAPVTAAPPRLPVTFESRMVVTPDATIFVQIGGAGDPVVLLHG